MDAPQQHLKDIEEPHTPYTEHAVHTLVDELVYKPTTVRTLGKLSIWTIPAPPPPVRYGFPIAPVSSYRCLVFTLTIYLSLCTGVQHHWTPISFTKGPSCLLFFYQISVCLSVWVVWGTYQNIALALADGTLVARLAVEWNASPRRPLSSLRC